MIHIVEKVSLSNVRTALKEFGSSVKKVVPFKQTKQPVLPEDEFNRSGSEPRSSEERTNTVVIKYNEANKDRLVAEINRSGEIESVYDKLLPEYAAYQNPELTDLTAVSADTFSASYRGNPVEIKSKTLEDGNKQYEINFGDGSQISYVSFSKNGKKEIYGEEFKMPRGTVVETKSANGRVFSQLIQLPGVQRNSINKPEYLNKIEQNTTVIL